MENELRSVQDSTRDVGLLVHEDFLKDWMDPDFGLLTKLRTRNALSREEIDEIKNQQTYRLRNLKIIHLIFHKKKIKELIEALRDAKQTHLANYLIANGEYKPEFGGDWRLGEKEILIIDANEEYLVESLDTRDLLSPLFSTGVINKWQMEFISSKPTSFNRNEELLEILRRSSLSSYSMTIKCLRSSNQRHIADMLEKGGVLVQTDVTLDSMTVKVDKVEAEIAAIITNILSQRTLSESNLILELVQLRLVGAKVGHSVALYFHCLEAREVDHLQELCESGHLTNIIGTVFKRLVTSGVYIRVEVKWTVDRFNRARNFCKAIESTQHTLEKDKTRQFPQETKNLELLSKLEMNELPFELMDLILLKSYLCFVMLDRKSPGCTYGHDLFGRMSSVDFCWFQRLRKKRFKRRIWRHLAVIYKNVDNFAVYRNNRYYFVENIQPMVVISRLRLADCVTDVNTRLIIRNKHRASKAKRNNIPINEELLHVMRSFSNDARYPDIIRCLRQSNENVIGSITQNGGATIKIKIVTRNKTNHEEVMQQLFRRLNDLQDEKIPVELDELMSRLKDDELEIINSSPDRQLVVWIWSQSQIAFDNLRFLDDQHDLGKLLSYLTKTSQSDTGSVRAAIQRRRPNFDIDGDQFNKALVMFPVFVNFTGSLRVEKAEFVVGVAKLRTGIYVLCRSVSSSSVIQVFPDREPFLLQRKIELKTVKFPGDVVASERDNCLYVIDTGNQCIWKIIAELDSGHRISKWMSTGIDWSSLLSVTRDKDLLIVRGCSPQSRLEIYGTDANLLLSIHLPQEIEFPQHAVETSTGDFIILHECIDEDKDVAIWKWLIWEVTRNGKMIKRRFTPQGLEQELYAPHNILIDSDDRVLIADTGHGRVILLDSNFRWNGVLLNELMDLPLKLCYDDAKKQLVVTLASPESYPIIYCFM